MFIYAKLKFGQNSMQHNIHVLQDKIAEIKNMLFDVYLSLFE
jgi:hypothetical protein